MKDFLTFRRMITPALIQIAFWLGAVACVVVGLGMIVTAPGASPSWTESKAQAVAGQFLIGIAVLVVGPIVVRIYSELLILLFRMNESLTEIRNGLPRASA